MSESGGRSSQLTIENVKSRLMWESGGQSPQGNFEIEEVNLT
jgi:hypothetical protein